MNQETNQNFTRSSSSSSSSADREGNDSVPVVNCLEDVANMLPVSLWADEPDVGNVYQHHRSDSHGSPTGMGGVSAESLRMSQADKMQAAMKTIAHLQEWAVKQNSGSNGGSYGPHQQSHGYRPSMIGQEMYGANTMPSSAVPLPRQQHQPRLHAHELEYAAMLQRIIQDYLAGKQLSIMERQLLEQYIQMEQQNRVSQQQMQQRQQELMIQRLYQEQLERMDRLSRAGMGGMMGSGGIGMGMDAMSAMNGGIRGMPAVGNTGNAGNVGVIGGHAGRPKGHRNDQYTGNFGGNEAPQHRRQTGHAGMPNGAYGNDKGGRGNAHSHSTPKQAAINPVQTLQEIGRTLSELGITVEVAVNAGLLGGLSATDVRVVADAHRLENELKGRTVSRNGSGNGQQSNFRPVVASDNSFSDGNALNVGSAYSSLPKSPGPTSFGNASAPSPSSPAWSSGSLPQQFTTGSLPTMLPYGMESGEAANDSNSQGSQGDVSNRSNASNGSNGPESSEGPEMPPSKAKSLSESINISTGDDQTSGSASLLGDQQKDEDSGGERELGEFAHEDEKEVENTDVKISSYLDSLSLGTGW